MILTVTLNPSVDKRYQVDDVIKGTVMRASAVYPTAGGKGLNVSRVIRLLGEQVTATGLLGGRAGDYIAEELQEQGIINRFVRIQEETRSCLAFLDRGNSQTEVLEPGPTVSRDELERFLAVFEELAGHHQIICLSGSLPRNVPINIYRDMIEIARTKRARVLLDSSGEALRSGIDAGPFFIKPNRSELEALAGTKLAGEDEIFEQVDRLHRCGIDNVAVSLGKEGALAVLGGKHYRLSVPRVNAVNPVGSGDASLAGMAVGLKRGYSVEHALGFACACGTANAVEAATGVVNPQLVDELYSQINLLPC